MLEEKLTRTLKDVERRERKLLAAEDNLAQREKDLLVCVIFLCFKMH
jgi:hypothetical protein